MNTKTLLLSIAASFALCLSASAAEKHDHDHGPEKAVAAPNGGRLLTVVEPHAEFLVLPDRKVQIAFVDDEGRPVPAGEQVVIVTAGDRSAPTRLSFVKSGDLLVSDAALPEGNNFPAVVQIRTTPEAKAVAAKFVVNLTNCPECDRPEYACICSHANDDHKGHKH